MEGGVTGAWCLSNRWLCASFFRSQYEKSSQAMSGRPQCKVRIISFSILIIQGDFVSTPDQLPTQ
eukprot:6487976-Prorocentrum_lima.AAC.1